MIPPNIFVEIYYRLSVTSIFHFVNEDSGEETSFDDISKTSILVYLKKIIALFFWFVKGF